MTVSGNIGFGLKVARKTPDEIKRVGEMLDLINMPEYGKRYPHQLSGGQQQRVALARALALDSPDVLLLDEPLSALDAKIRVSLRSEIRSIQKKLGITAIYVTHDQEEALSISDRVVVMYKGQMEQVGTPFQVYNFPETAFVAQFVGTLNTVSAEVIDPDKKVLRIDGVQLETADALNGRKQGDKLTIRLAQNGLLLSLPRKKPTCLIASSRTSPSSVRLYVFRSRWEVTTSTWIPSIIPSSNFLQLAQRNRSPVLVRRCSS